MITITITSDESLTDPHFDVLHRACREVAESTGQLVHVKAEFTIAPVPVPTVRTDFSQYKLHPWPNFGDSIVNFAKTPPGPNIDSGATVKESLTTDGWIPWHGGDMPVAGDVRVDYVLRFGGDRSPRAADSLLWDHDGSDGDIMCYRIHKPVVPCTITTSSLVKDQAS